MNFLQSRKFRFSIVSSLLLLLGATAAHAEPLKAYCDGHMPQATFVLEELRSALDTPITQVPLSAISREAKGPQIVLATTADTAVLTSMKAAGCKPAEDLESEGFSIRVTTKDDGATYWVIGADAAGLMYGGLELAEVARIGRLDAVEDLDQNAYMAMRGTKFNIPLDVRTPTYTEPCDAAQKNMPEMWNLDFWKEYIDNLARHRYNFVSLWSLQPFPSMVKTPGYEDVALDDVRRSTIEWEEYYNGTGVGFDAPEIVDNYETLKEMSIEEKIDFWRQVMRYAKGRNVVFYVVTWNIFVNGTDGKHGITDSIKNPTTRDYFRKSVKQMLLTYPDLAGVGLTTGENMHGAKFDEKEDWAFETYGQGVLDAANEMPDQKITLIHRQHMTGAKDIARKFQPVIDQENVDFIFSFKYAKAHVFSSTTQPYHPGFVKDIEGMKTIWTLRNDDVYYFRWGAPDFVREFFENIPYEVSQGYYYGSDQWVWGREFLAREPESPRQIELAKHWYHWMLWGRLGYDPTVSNERFIGILDQHFPQVSGEDLFTAWQEASMIYPVTTGFHWGSLDFQWYIEACKSRSGPAQTESGFHDVNRFITLGTHGGTDNISIPDYVKAVTAGKDVEGTTPIEVAQKLHGHADKALEMLAGMSHGGNQELRHTLDDIRTIALLGKYYAHKIRGATELALFRKTGEAVHQQAAIAELNQAAGYWRRYASTALGQYTNPLWTNRVGHCDWRRLFEFVLDDVRTAGGEPEIASIAPTPGGTILEAEDADSHGMRKVTDESGTTYLEPIGWTKNFIYWIVEVPTAGTYVLELRYALAGYEDRSLDVQVNGNSVGPLRVWETGGKSTWAWDRLPVELKKGTNRVRISAGHLPAVDLMNVLSTEALAPK
jgi:glycosyl hydrolase family 67